ncbi:MAG: antitoxin [Bryobacteraceae bacterium]
MRITVTLDDDVYQASKELAQVSSRSFGAVLSELARRGLTRAGPAGKDAFPIMPCTSVAPACAEEAIDDECLF